MLGIGQFEFEDLGIVVVWDYFCKFQVDKALVATSEGLRSGHGGLCVLGRFGSSVSGRFFASEE